MYYLKDKTSNKEIRSDCVEVFYIHIELNCMLVKWISKDISLSLIHLKINYQNAVGGQFYSKGQNITIICLQSV